MGKGNSSTKHIHKYQLITLKTSGRKVFKCMLPDCPHYLPEIELAIGRLTVCNGNCGETFAITQEHLSKTRPVCPNCKEIRLRRNLALMAVGRSAEVSDDD